MTDSTLADEERRARIVQQMREQTGIDERMIEQLVRGFYARVREDSLLGPIFNARIHDWEPHLQRMCAFWSSVGLSSGVYHGQPMRMHLPLPVEARHFDRWLEFFEQTARHLFNGEVAQYFIERARRIATSDLELHEIRETLERVTHWHPEEEGVRVDTAINAPASCCF
jgi:hemoglobin